MTEQKNFKRLVRSRMLKTGESYTAARTQLLTHKPKASENGWNLFGGIHWETASLHKLLAHAGTNLSEELLFGIGGGIGCAYFVFDYCDFKTLFIGSRLLTKTVDFPSAICRRLKLPVEISSKSGTRAETVLRNAIQGGTPAMIWCDRASLPYAAVPKDMPYEHTLVAYAFDDDTGSYLVSDTSEKPLTLRSSDLAAARKRVTAKKKKNQVLTLKTAGKQLDANLADAIVQGIHECIDVMLHPEMANFGLKSLDKWAQLVANSKDKKGWPVVFKADADLHKALSQTYFWIELFGTGGGAARPMYARFLEEAGTILRKPALKQAATRYRELGRMWTDLANFALPFEKTKELMVRKDRLFRKRGAAAREELEAIERELRSVSSKAEVSSGRRLLPDLAKRVRELAGAERDAIQNLKEVL